MGADPQILAVQDHDADADRIRHEMSTLPELAERDAALARRAELSGRRLALEERRGPPQSELGRLDDEVALLRAKLEREETKLGSGHVTNARELTGLQAEVESLRRRIADLEDRELEAMEELESTQPELDALESELADVDASLAPIEERLQGALAALEAELDRTEAARSAAAEVVDAELLAKYERTRARSVNGIGAALLADGGCTGCHVKLAAGELVDAREADLARCPACEAILVLEEG